MLFSMFWACSKYVAGLIVWGDWATLRAYIALFTLAINRHFSLNVMMFKLPLCWLGCWLITGNQKMSVACVGLAHHQAICLYALM